MPRLPLMIRCAVIPLALALTSVVLWMAGDDATLALRYERAAILDGEAWRLITGHLLHLGGSHLLLNLAGLGLIWVLVGSAFSTATWALVTLATVLGTSAGLWILNPQLEWYVGLSGVLHGLLVAGAVATIGIQRDAPLLLLVVAGKLVWEQWAGPLPGTAAAAGGPVIVDAHFYGAVSGLLMALTVLAWRRLRCSAAP